MPTGWNLPQICSFQQTDDRLLRIPLPCMSRRTSRHCEPIGGRRSAAAGGGPGSLARARSTRYGCGRCRRGDDSMATRAQSPPDLAVPPQRELRQVVERINSEHGYPGARLAPERPDVAARASQREGRGTGELGGATPAGSGARGSPAGRGAGRLTTGAAAPTAQLTARASDHALSPDAPGLSPP